MTVHGLHLTFDDGRQRAGAVQSKGGTNDLGIGIQQTIDQALVLRSRREAHRAICSGWEHFNCWFLRGNLDRTALGLLPELAHSLLGELLQVLFPIELDFMEGSP